MPSLPHQRRLCVKLISSRSKGYRATALAGRVVYRSVDEPRARPAFVDLGTKILVHAGNDPAAVRASLLLIASRYPDDKIAVTGDRAFQRLVLEIATQERIPLDGKLGRRQPRQVAERTVPLAPPFPRYELGSKHRDISSPQARSPASSGLTRSQSLAMLGRVFHDVGWLAGDYWGRSKDPAGRVDLPVRPRSIDDLSPAATAGSEQAKRSQADLARRAAAIALAARSR